MKKFENVSRMERNYTTVTPSPILVGLKTTRFYEKGFKAIFDFLDKLFNYSRINIVNFFVDGSIE